MEVRARWIVVEHAHHDSEETTQCRHEMLSLEVAACRGAARWSARLPGLPSRMFEPRWSRAPREALHAADGREIGPPEGGLPLPCPREPIEVTKLQRCLPSSRLHHDPAPGVVRYPRLVPKPLQPASPREIIPRLPARPPGTLLSGPRGDTTNRS
jgi:hypothetical protein